MQVPHIFSPGFPSKANEVNENFAALAEAITNLEARVAAVEGAAPIPGKYFLMGYQTGLIPAGQGAIIEGIVYTGNVTLGEGTTSGAASLVINEFKNQLNVGPNGSSRQSITVPPDTIGSSWNTTSGAALALVVPDDNNQPRTLRFARGAGRLYIGNHLNPNDGSTVMLFLVRTGNL